MSISVENLIKNPETTPFSRIKYLKRASEEDVVEFMNGLFNVAVEARDSGQWSALENYLDEWEQRLVNKMSTIFKPSESPDIPWARLTRPLSECRVALITTGGVYVEGQDPYDVNGDWSYREIPRDAPRQRLRIAHTHYDTSGAVEDVNCVFPIERFRTLEAEGIIGELSPINYGFMGFIPKPEGLIRETAPAVARSLKQAGADAVVIGTT